MRIGAHQSVAGGHHRAFAHAQADGCEAIQIFTKNASQWKEPVLTPEQITQFKEARAASSIASTPILCHDSYLINLSAKDEAMRTKSREALLHEALRCEQLGVDAIVLHPGAHMGVGVDAAIDLVVEGLAWVVSRSRGAKVSLLVENTAGQGSVIASKFEEIGAILRGVEQVAGTEGRARSGVCFDTCHAFAAGYDLSHPEGFDAAFDAFEAHVGVARIRAMHLNDSQKGVGCKLDRHERIGDGALGKYAFWRLMNDARLNDVVGVLETPPNEDEAKETPTYRAFRRQLLELRGFVGAPAPSFKRPGEFALEVQAPAKKKRAKKA